MTARPAVDIPVRNLKAVIEYDGTRFLGWQIQARGPTVQGEIEVALTALTGVAVRIQGSGRTDSGVHAVEQVASFRVASRIPTDRFAGALNAHLPRDISVLGIEEMEPDFHARFHARAKHYRYVILNRRSRPAIDRHRAYHLAAPVDEHRMAEAASLLVGRHDFRSFATVDPARRDASCVREMVRLEVSRSGDRVILDFIASGFLYNMARCLAGTLLNVGLGKWDGVRIQEILEARDRREAGPCLPAGGLTLMRVFYQDPRPDLESRDVTYWQEIRSERREARPDKKGHNSRKGKN